MEKEKLESLIIDYIDNKLNTAEKQLVEQELVSNPEAYKLYEELKEVIQVMDASSKFEPSVNMKHRFDEMLLEEIKSGKGGKTVFFNPVIYRVAAAVTILLLGIAIGYWINRHNDQSEEIAKIKVQMEEQKSMMMSLLHNDQSASQRIQGVNVAMKIDQADRDIVNALVKTMNEDANSNVRLAALEALSKFTNDAYVKNILIESLATQKDPVVQISLIQLLVKMNEKGVVKDLQKIVDDTETMKAVKDEAYSGILKLS